MAISARFVAIFRYFLLEEIQSVAESESYQSMTVFLSGFFPFSEESLHPGTSLEQDSKVQDVGLPVKPPSLSALLAIAGDLATDVLSLCFVFTASVVGGRPGRRAPTRASNPVPMLPVGREQEPARCGAERRRVLLAVPSGPCGDS